MLAIAWIAAGLAQVATSPLDTAVTKAALLSADRNLSRIAAANPAVFLDRLEADAPLLFPTLPVLRGPENARKLYLERYAPGQHFGWTPLHAVASSNGRFGCTTGTTHSQASTDSVPRYGRYLTCWQKGSDGRLRVAVHARNGETATVPLPGTALEGAPHSAASSSTDLDAALVSDAAFARFALDSGPAAAFARYAASDAMLLGGRASPPRGPEEIRAVFAGFGADQRLLWNPLRGVGVASGGLAFTIGLSATGSVAGRDEQAQGHYLTIWRRETDGSWRFVFDLGSGRPADTPIDGHLALAVRVQARLDSLRASGEYRGASFTTVFPDGRALLFTTGATSPVMAGKTSPTQGALHTSLGEATKSRVTRPGYDMEMLDFASLKLKAALGILSSVPTPPEKLESATIELAQIVAGTL